MRRVGIIFEPKSEQDVSQPAQLIDEQIDSTHDEELEEQHKQRKVSRKKEG